MHPRNFFFRLESLENLINGKIYNPCWLQIIHALATLIELESEHVFVALDSHGTEGRDGNDIAAESNYRDEPVAFFFIIYGLCFQTLLRMMNKDESEAKRTIPSVLDAFRKFLRPSISGNAMYKGFVFAETTDLLDRLVLMESSDVQLTVIHIAASLAKYHPNALDRQRNER
jgi:HEAT repeat-containing protein 5